MILLFAFCLVAPAGHAQSHTQPGAAAVTRPTGVAWRVQGNWQQDAHGSPLRTGDPLLPGALLMPMDLTATHSITLLLPDGQRILYECFTEEDCSRGFRIPPLTEKPSPLATRILQQISGVMVQNRADPGSRSGPAPASPANPARTTAAKRDEALAMLDHDNQASVGGLLANLPNGEYTYNLVPLDHLRAPRLQVPLHKSSTTCIFPVPSAGLFEISIWDSQNTPRINLFLAAIQPQQAAAFSTYAPAKKLLAEWDEEYYGWPTHDLLRAYLQALAHAAGNAQEKQSAPSTTR